MSGHEMGNQSVKRVVIAGGGTAGWAAASALAAQLGPLLDITLVESEQIGTVGVGEATIPTFRTFHKLLGIEEQEFMRETQASFKLGIAFENWGRVGDRYIHPFGDVGQSSWMGDFHNLWLMAKSQGFGGDLDEYCFELQAAEAGKFALPDKGQINYAYHLDASLYAAYLRRKFEAGGTVTRIEGKIASVEQDAENGFVTALVLEDGQRVEGDLFVDCTGFRGLLIEQTLGAGYEDWRHWLPTDSALAVQTELSGEILPYTRAIARSAGWQWRIPLQSRVGNGIVFCSEHQAEDEARSELLANLEGEPLMDPRLIRYVTGRRKKFWDKNVIALGLSSGFLEPLESTSIHLIQIGVSRLIQLFPFEGNFEVLAKRFNEKTRIEFECVRDFLILHYKLTERDDTSFWRACRDMDIPDSLAERIELFRGSGYVHQTGDDLFRVASWLYVMIGQGVVPQHHHYMGALLGEQQLRRALGSLQESIAAAVAKMPSHRDFLERYCAAQ
jgi:tryptophan halogenase